MGTYVKSNFGKISGKVGNGVASKWRGINYLRSTPTKTKRPHTPAQLAVHAKLVLSAALLSPVKDILKIGFCDKKLNGISGYNAAVKTFITNSILGEYPEYIIDYPGMQFSRGSLSHLQSLALENSPELSIIWKTKVNGVNSFNDDVVFIITYNQHKNLYTVDNLARRVSAKAILDLEAHPGDTLHVWAFCVKRDGKDTSKTQYVGSITV